MSQAYNLMNLICIPLMTQWVKHTLYLSQWAKYTNKKAKPNIHPILPNEPQSNEPYVNRKMSQTYTIYTYFPMSQTYNLKSQAHTSMRQTYTQMANEPYTQMSRTHKPQWAAQTPRWARHLFLTINGRGIYTAPCVMILMLGNPLQWPK